MYIVINDDTGDIAASYPTMEAAQQAADEINTEDGGAATWQVRAFRSYAVITTVGTPAELWSDDTYTLHFGAGFDDQCESTPELLAAAVDGPSLGVIIATILDTG